MCIEPGRGFLAAMAFVLFVSPVFGAPVPCADPMFLVDAPDEPMGRHLCTLATHTRERLEGCGLTQDEVLTIELVERLSHPLGSCLAYFDCEYDLVRIIDPAVWDGLLRGDEPYAELPAEIALTALLTHEIAHALVTQTAGDRTTPMVDQEYIAAAMELEFMDRAWRDALISRAPVELPPKEDLIDLRIYGFAPRTFAVNAWQHFSLPGNGCPLVRRLVQGDASFARPVRPELR